MGWTDFTFSTLQSIARHESEINNMARSTSRKVITSPVGTLKFAAVPDTITAIAAVTSSNTVIDLVYAEDTKRWALPAGVYTRLNLTTEDDYFSLSEGTGNVLTSANGDYTLTCTTSITWTDLSVGGTWNDKIDIAKETIRLLIQDTLINRYTGYGWDYDEIIDAITNPEVLNLASDYKTLESIYMDLSGKAGNIEVYQSKIDQYSNKFASAIQSAMNALDFGNYGKPYKSNMGRVSR